MEAIIIVLLIIVLIFLVTFRTYATDYFKKIDAEIQELKYSLTASKQQASKTVATEPTKEAPKETKEPEFEPIIKAQEKPIAPVLAKEEAPQQIKSITPVQKEPEIIPFITQKKSNPPSAPPPSKPTFFERNPDLEKFIGENLVSKIGIAILVLAIGFFVKFAIDNDWIGPAGRVGIGILCGGILVTLAHRLRNSYHAFSSVLIGGGIAVFYFTITLAYQQFHLFSQTASFIIMIVITVFTVILSLLYDRQELAIIALIGGFAAPFLVSDGSGNYKVLFSYLIILNAGLLIIAYNKAWRLMNILAFIFTVILFGSWLFSLPDATPTITYRNALIFAAIFYLLFFFINIANNIKENKQFIAADFSILLINTALFFATGLYCITVMDKPGYRGLFTAMIGVFNLIASYFLFRKKSVDTNILYLLIGITLTFISLTAPIQLHGNNITLFWASETVLLLWLYQRSKIEIIQYASLIIWFAMLISLVLDWSNVYSDGSLTVRIILNKAFITGLYCSVASYILFILRRKTVSENNYSLEKAIKKNTFRITALILLFLTGSLEVNFQFLYYFSNSGLNILYLQLYTFLFILLVLFITSRIEPLKLSVTLRSVLLSACILFYLFSLGAVTDLQSHLLETQQFTAYFNAEWLIAILIGTIFYNLIQIIRNEQPASKTNSSFFVWLICGAIVIFLSFEAFWLTNSIFYSKDNSLAYIERVFIKTCLPILWGVCSFCFMWLGMRYKFKPLRIISLVLFLFTLLKLFLFDITNIPVAGKIAAFFCLGVLLLVISFMYQRLKKIIIQDEEKKPL